MGATDIVGRMPRHVVKIVADLASDPSVKEVWLIGSQAQKSPSPSSDWDLLVHSDREPYHSPRRHEEVDVLWCGPSGRLQVESEYNYPELQFSDFEWEPIDTDRATYTAKKFREFEPGLLRDISEPVYIKSRQPALLIWRRCSAQRL